MPRTKISEFSSTPANNTDIDSINISEGCAPSGINDAIRELMSQLKDWQSGTSNDPMVIGSSGSLTLNQGTANGVAYLNGSKVVTSGSGLTFNGTNLSVGNGSAGNFEVGSGGYGYLVSMTNVGSKYAIRTLNNTDKELYINDSAGGFTKVITYIDGSEATRLNTTGLGIGISSPATKLHVAGSTGLTLGVIAGNAWRTAAIAPIDEGDSFKGALAFYTHPSAGSAGAPTERARIDSFGNLLVGTTSSFSTWRATIQAAGNEALGAISSNASAFPYVAWNQATSGNNVFVGFYTEGTITNRGSISYNRGAGLVVYNTTSDYRAKDISGPVTNSGELIDSTPVYMGKMKGATQERPMFIAHETPSYAHTGEKDAVDENGNPVYQQMDASALIPVMWAEIQSLRKRLADAGL